MSRGRHLVLIGLMGAGKSTIGTACAAALGRALVDTDDLVVGVAGATIEEIFATEGEAGFRERERRAVADVVASPDPLVIACGGGAPLDPANRRALRDQGFVVWLRAPSEVLAARVGAGHGRPLLAGDPATVLARLESVRDGAYRATADVEIDTTVGDVDAVCSSVLAAYRAEGVA